MALFRKKLQRIDIKLHIIKMVINTMKDSGKMEKWMDKELHMVKVVVK